MLWLALTIGLFGAAADDPPDNSRPKCPERPVVHSTTRAFRIPFQIPDPADAKNLRELQLYVARSGADWEKYSSCPADASPETRSFIFQADSDGEYWFAIRTIDKWGDANPQDDRDLQVELRVAIRTNQQLADKLSPERNSRRLARRAKPDRASPPTREENSKQNVAHLPARIDEVLYWLPADTETLIVAHGPIPVGRSDDMAEAPTERIFQFLPILLLSAVADEKSAKLLAGAKIELAIQGSRRFQAPSGLGMMRFEGCEMVLFEGNASPACERFLQSIEGQANEVLELRGHRVLVFKKTFEQDSWTLLATRPKPNVLLCATDRGYLQQVLDRIGKKSETRAMPSNLPEWKFVDVEAPVWAVRHYSQDARMHATDLDDDQAVGITFHFLPDIKTARVVYLSNSKSTLEKARNVWRQPNEGLMPVIRQLEPGAISITTSHLDEEALGMFLFILQAALGHAIVV
jgi:hypothetical protein